jgi:hypothetical protein
MDPGTHLAVLLILMVVFGGIVGAIAQSRGHNFWLFFAIGGLLSPLIGILCALLIPAPAGGGRRVRRRAPPGRGTARGRTAGTGTQRRVPPTRR